MEPSTDDGVVLRQVSDLVDSLVAARLPAAVAAELERQDLVPRPEWSADQPSAALFLLEVSLALQEATKRGPGTYVGAHQVLATVAKQMGVAGAASLPVLRRSRAQVDAAPNPDQPREGMGRARYVPDAPTWPVELSLREQRDAVRRRNRARGITTAPEEHPLTDANEGSAS